MNESEIRKKVSHKVAACIAMCPWNKVIIGL